MEYMKRKQAKVSMITNALRTNPKNINIYIYTHIYNIYTVDFSLLSIFGTHLLCIRQR